MNNMPPAMVKKWFHRTHDYFVDRDLGTIELHPQPLTEWGDREDHAKATIVMDARGRDRLIAALVEGRDAIEVHGESGGGYTLNLQSKSAE